MSLSSLELLRRYALPTRQDLPSYLIALLLRVALSTTLVSWMQHEDRPVDVGTVIASAASSATPTSAGWSVSPPPDPLMP